MITNCNSEKVQLVAQDMTWIVPLYARKQVDRAGSVLLRSDSTYVEKSEAMEIISNWRSCHSFPLYVFKKRLRRLALVVSNEAIVSGRIKRFPSILSKLARHDWLKCSRIQDIAGCRAVMPDVTDIDTLVSLYKRHSTKHGEPRVDDYVKYPKSDGYRSVHLIYKYHSDRKDTYDGLHVEIQIRSEFQHQWATMVETVDAFTQQLLKFGLGERKWERFFLLTSFVISAMEKRPFGEWTTRDPDDILNEINELIDELNVENRLNAYKDAIKAVEQISTKASYFLLALDKVGQVLDVTGYKQKQLPEAVQRYKEIEEGHKDFNVVLASASSTRELRLAYPNYYVDTTEFLALIRAIRSFAGK